MVNPPNPLGRGDGGGEGWGEDRQKVAEKKIITQPKNKKIKKQPLQISLVIQVPDARDRAAAVAALLKLLLQALQPSILDHGGLQSYHGFSLIIDLRPENTLQVILKNIPIRYSAI